MGLFGGSTTKTSQSSTQYGASDQGIVIGEGATYRNEFSPEVAQFAESALGLAAQSVASGRDAISSLSGVAEREKTPLTEWLPIIAIGAAALVAVAYVMR